MKAITVWEDPKAPGVWVVVRMNVDEDTHEPLDSGSTLDSFDCREDAETFGHERAGELGLPCFTLET